MSIISRFLTADDLYRLFVENFPAFKGLIFDLHLELYMFCRDVMDNAATQKY